MKFKHVLTTDLPPPRLHKKLYPDLSKIRLRKYHVTDAYCKMIYDKIAYKR
ncbi:hypothetical protein SlGVgp071 [Spodoptera litura granulovirus]|uniref:Uncharacterized protein n=1 Tax=Spodoptera litura granulovirus TaxID=359919 RepID=A5IZS3_9BBAC|nr:hypothetical protein SlGVgp071 [Spodoptera litura granulovirus]ABQ52014.1 hypothetical protein SlGVgp071 [Spodoptera litura granulovirus]